MTLAFYIAAAVALAATFRAVTHADAVHALLYFIVSLLAAAVIFYILGAPFVAALEIIIYAGAIIVLFLFVVMLLHIGRGQRREERTWIRPRVWIGPAMLAAVLLAATVTVILAESPPAPYDLPQATAPSDIGVSLFGPYVVAVQLAALLLLAGLVGASHLRRHDKSTPLRAKGDPP
ncbi:MAG: NADH-quinone oxidoreductase subunit J [Opitutales bacterium]|nr:NADH-quinone oxidoreductase subunit J [Opitutales bacterium]